jgi:hypothetical protein
MLAEAPKQSAETPRTSKIILNLGTTIFIRKIKKTACTEYFCNKHRLHGSKPTIFSR